MDYIKLGTTSLTISKLCLGTMNFGEQNTEAEAHQQLDYAVEKGINFIDTAEMYPIPRNKDTQGKTEQFIGSWLKKSGKRDKVIIASKMSGPAVGLTHIAEDLRYSKARILHAIENNLKRLGVEQIELYQLHWPERKTNYFGNLGFVFDESDPWVDNFGEIIETLSQLQLEGKIRYWGLSNETPWGLYRTIQVADAMGLPRPSTIQNPYNLLNRTYEIGLAEMSIRENIPLLAYSPLAFGQLTGKYHLGKDKPTDRINQFKQMSRYNNTNCYNAIQKYIDLAEEVGMSPATLALAFIYQQPFVGATIIGATDLIQLKENIDAFSVKLTSEIMQKIDAIHLSNSNPAP